MYRPRFVLIAVAYLSLTTTACSSKDDKSEAKSKANTRTKLKAKPNNAEPKPVKRPARPVSCLRVLMTEKVTGGAGKLKVTLGDKTIDAAFEPKAEYPKNPVWTKVDTPAACGIVREGKSSSLLLIAFFQAAGRPAVRLQLGQVRPGVTTIGGKQRTTGLVRVGSANWALMFDKGTVKIAPEPLVAGKVSVEIKGGAGNAITRGKKSKFTLEGTFTGTFKSRPARR